MKISIITATYNSLHTLSYTIKSVLGQNYSDWEHIIIDGGSNDGSVELIKSMESQYGSRLKWTSEPDRGIYDAMNKGVAMATGDVIGILNADDFYTSDHILEDIANTLNCPDVDAVFGDIHFVDDRDLDKCVRYYCSRLFRPWMMLFGYQPAHPSFYCRKDIYDKYGLFDCSFKIAGDFEHLLRLLYVNKITARYLPLDFVTMRVGGVSTYGIKSRFQIIKEHGKAYRKNSLSFACATDYLRYPFKVAEIVYSKLFYNRRNFACQWHDKDVPVGMRQIL